jgi:hypothetical protein
MLSTFQFGFFALVLSTTSAAATTAKKAKINESQPKQQPNMLFLFPDQWRFDWDGGNDQTDRPPLHLPNTNAIASQATIPGLSGSTLRLLPFYLSYG